MLRHKWLFYEAFVVRPHLEAVEMGHEAIAGWIDAARAWGRPVPPPHVYRDRDVAS